MSNPFLASTSKAGHGEITLSILPPHTPRLKTCSYQYPLKLVAPDPLHVEDSSLVHTVYLLSYGGGLVAGDSINLTVNVDATARLVLLTQGSTKIFISAKPEIITRQSLNVHLNPGSALVYLPDPVQPFKQSAFEQTQVYHLPSLKDGERANLCVCDWVCRGRSARGEDWNVWRYTSKNEVWLSPTSPSPTSSTSSTEDRTSNLSPTQKLKLLLRDNLFLEDGTASGSFADRIDHLGAYGTLIIHGPHFEKLSRFFMAEFEALPRIGARTWDGEAPENAGDSDWRKRREAQEKEDGVLWTAARMRGFVLVKFGAREVEGVKRWLLSMIREEGSVEKVVGARALMCLRS